jgi:hypothetical protein
MKINITGTIFCTAAILIASAAAGQTQVPNTFQADQPARAVEVNENFTTLESAVNQNADDIAQVQSLSWMGDWQAGVNYAADDLVQFQGSAYIAEQATSGTEDPTDAAFWSLFAAEGAIGPTGPQGLQGPQGTVGPQGLQGDVGLQGPQGVDGPIGPQGPAGVDAVIDAALVQTRVNGICAFGFFVAAVAEDGSVTCATGSDGFNTRYGNTALANNTTGFVNTAVGVGALQFNTDGRFNTAIGVDALGDNTLGRFNTASGANALWHNTTGYSNTATGMNALFDNTSGSENTANGRGALFANTSANANVATGFLSMHLNTIGDQNTATGHRSLYSNIDGYNNTVSGFQALSANVDGHDNTVIGAWARANNSSGSGNLILGAFAGINDNGVGSNNIIVAHTGVLDDDVTTRIGEFQTRAFIAGIQGVTTGINDAVNVVIDSNGQLGTASSSRRYKEDINDMGSASDRLLQLHPVTFRYKESYANGEQPLDYGLIAEEVAEVFPELVVFNGENQPETVKYRLLSSLLLNELQKQHSRLSGQVAEIGELKEQLTELSELVNRMALPENNASQWVCSGPSMNQSCGQTP